MQYELQIYAVTHHLAMKPLFKPCSGILTSSECLAVTGENGSGKSSLLRIIAGLMPPATGSVTLMHQDVAIPMQGACHYLAHQNGFKPASTVYEQCMLWVQLQNLTPDHDAIMNILDVLQLQKLRDQRLEHLSCGQKRRVALAKLQLVKKPLWILDEPLSGLDRLSEEWFVSELQKHLEDGGLAVVSTHQILHLHPECHLREWKIES